MKVIKQTYLIKASPEEVWKALTDAEEIEKWGGGPAKMDDKKGTKFSLWGGSIHGTNITVIANKTLEQDWISEDDGEWEQPSIVKFNLHAEKDGTRVELIQKQVPDEYEKNLSNGWKDYYMGPLKNYLESKK